MIAGSEFVRLERDHQQKISLSNGHVTDTYESEIQSRLSAEASIKSAMQIYVKFSSGIILDCWSETNRYKSFLFYFISYYATWYLLLSFSVIPFILPGP